MCMLWRVSFVVCSSRDIGESDLATAAGDRRCEVQAGLVVCGTSHGDLSLVVRLSSAIKRAALSVLRASKVLEARLVDRVEVCLLSKSAAREKVEGISDGSTGLNQVAAGLVKLELGGRDGGGDKADCSTLSSTD